MNHDDLNACADLVRRGDPDRFMAAMAAPVAARSILFPLYAFNVEVARAPWLTQEHMIAEMRLQWWRDALGEIAAGGAIRRHEVVTPLSAVLDAEGAGLLEQLIEVRRWDIYRDPFQDDAQFQDYLFKTSGNLMWVAARALGAPENARDTVYKAGFALGLANLFRAVPALEAAGRYPLVDGRPEAVQALAVDGMARLKAARKARAVVPVPARAAMLPLWQTSMLLKRAAIDPRLVASGTLDIAPIRSRLALMARAATGLW